MKIYIDTVEATQLVCNRLNSFLLLPGCSLLNMSGNKNKLKDTFGNRLFQMCSCSSEYTDPACRFVSEMISPMVSDFDHIGYSAVQLPQTFIDAELLEEEKLLLVDNLPANWLITSTDY